MRARLISRTTLARWRRNWSETAPSSESKTNANEHAQVLLDALNQGDNQRAHQSFAEMHLWAQNDFRRHPWSHYLEARIYLQEQRWRGLAIHTYLGVMAPYGTLCRRLAGCHLEDPNPPSLMARFSRLRPSPTG